MADLARMVFHERHFSRRKNLVKPGAFDPGASGSLSTFAIGGLDTSDVHELCRRVGTLRGIEPKGWAGLQFESLSVFGLEFVRDDQPIERHGNVIGFAIGDDDEARAARKEVATSLAARAALTLYAA